jgi:F-type H+-transporting ATPase subunit b
VNPNLTMLAQTISIIIFVWFCMKYVWPPLIETIEARQKKIADGLAAADRGENDLVLAQEKATGILKEAKVKAAEIVEQANKRHAQIVDDAKGDAVAAADKVKAAAEAELAQEVAKAREALRAQVAALAVSGAGKILERSIDQEAHADILDKVVAEL